MTETDKSDLSDRKINDELFLYKRPNSSRWQARIRRTSNQWFTMTCKTTDFETAKKVALARQSELKQAQSSGLVDVSRKFVDVARLTIKILNEENEMGVGKAVNRDYIQVINRYLIPVFGKTLITMINAQKLVELDSYRKKKIGRDPNRSTINTHNAALKRVFRTALDKGYLHSSQVPNLVNRGKPTQARPYFDIDDYRKLSRRLRDFATTGHKTSTKMLRELLWDYVLILANTGMRPGVESMNVKWNQIKRTKELDENSLKREYIEVLKISVTGKKRKRTLIGRDVDSNITTPLKRIQSRFPDLANLSESELFKVDEYVFRTADGKRPEFGRLIKTFKIFLKENDLLKDLDGAERSLYSLRHTYATMSLRNGISWDTLAVGMGTSRIMLERHYSKFKVEDRAAAFSGHNLARRRQKAQELSEVERLRAELAKLKAIHGMI
jgi:integrase